MFWLAVGLPKAVGRRTLPATSLRQQGHQITLEYFDSHCGAGPLAAWRRCQSWTPPRIQGRQVRSLQRKQLALQRPPRRSQLAERPKPARGQQLGQSQLDRSQRCPRCQPRRRRERNRLPAHCGGDQRARPLRKAGQSQQLLQTALATRDCPRAGTRLPAPSLCLQQLGGLQSVASHKFEHSRGSHSSLSAADRSIGATPLTSLDNICPRDRGGAPGVVRGPVLGGGLVKFNAKMQCAEAMFMDEQVLTSRRQCLDALAAASSARHQYI